MHLKESAYNVEVNLLGGRILLYNAMSRALCVLEREDVADLRALPDIRFEDDGSAINSKYRDMCSQGFVVPGETNELELVQRMYHQSRYSGATVNLTVCSTLACNFGCDYCFQGADKSVHVMQQEVRDGILALYQRIVEKTPDLQRAQFIWYGGEPLVKKQFIYDIADQLIEHSDAKGIQYTASMVSNGYLMNRKVAGELADRGLRMVQITLDGSEEHHDGRRHLLSGKGTYARILDNVSEWIDELEISVNIRVNIDDRNKGDICNLIDDLSARGFAGKKNFKLYFSPVEAITKGCHNISDNTMMKLQYGELEAELYRYAFEHGLADLPYPTPFLGICSALRPMDFIITPNGDVHNCWDTVSFPDKKIGSVFDIDGLLDIGGNTARHVWESFSPFENEICNSCTLLPNCASFCAHKFVFAEDAAGDSVLPCPPMKFSFNERLVLRAEKAGYITRDDYTAEGIKTDPYALTPKAHTIESMVGDKRRRTAAMSLPVLQY